MLDFKNCEFSDFTKSSTSLLISINIQCGPPNHNNDLRTPLVPQYVSASLAEHYYQRLTRG